LVRSLASRLGKPKTEAHSYIEERAFFGVWALLFGARAAVTIVWCAAMSVRT
jgi:hypothetical protein